MSNAPIAITGMHRSGTSMITRALHDSGLHLIGDESEELIDAAEDNPEGFWENKAIVACNDELLEAVGGAWDNPPDLPPQAIDDPRVAHIADASTAAIAALSEHDRWGFKDPRTCLTAAYWLDLEPRLRFVICVRHPLEVALSLKRRNQNSYSLGLALWERYYTTVLQQVPAERRIVTHYDTYFVDPEGELARLCAFAALEPAPPRVRTDLRHHTIGIDLADAGASESLRTLYEDLCRSAGVTPPRDAPADEGRVRRLILDGAVAQRHAVQRQAAIERLEEREQALRAERAEAEARHRRDVRDLEIKAARFEQMQRDTAAKLATLQTSVARIDHRTSRAPSVVLGNIARRHVLRPLRRLVHRGRRTAAPAAHSAVERLPSPAQQAIRRSRRLARRAVEQPVPTAKITGRRALRTARTTAGRLPPPGQQVLRRGRSLYRRTTAAPVPTAKAAVHRLPTPAQKVVRRSWKRMRRAQGARADRPAIGEAAPRPHTPKGPALRHWKPGYLQMVADAWRGDAPWLVVAPGSPREVRDARSPRGTWFPDTRQPLAADLSHIAHLEAQRYHGYTRLVLPEGSRPWFRQQAELRDHVMRCYRTEVDLDGAGAVFDLTRGADADAQTLRSTIAQLTVGGPQPAVLDWSRLDVAAEIGDLATFRPPDGDRLPYLDSTVDVVVIDRSRDRGEARRVASRGVITVSAGPSSASVDRIEPVGSVRDPEALRVLVWSSATSDPRWAAALTSRVDKADATLSLGALSAVGLEHVADHEVVVIVEPHVLPLPGAIEAAAALARAEPDRAVAGKVVRADGRLESAGGSVFLDRSVALIGEGSPDVSAPWHEFTRPVCWAPGFLAASAALLASVPPPPHVTERAFLREWCAAAWAHGALVVYQPTVAAVRVSGDGGEPSTPVSSSAWQRVLDLRPARPDPLGDGAWRFLLAHDDVEACRA